MVTDVLVFSSSGVAVMMEMMAWSFEEEMGDVLFHHGDRQYRVEEESSSSHGCNDHTRS